MAPKSHRRITASAPKFGPQSALTNPFNAYETRKTNHSHQYSNLHFYSGGWFPPGRTDPNHRNARLARRHDNNKRKTTPAARSEVRWRDQERCLAIQAMVGTAHSAAQTGAQHPAHHDRRLGLRRAEHVRRRHPDTDDGSHREGGAAVQ